MIPEGASYYLSWRLDVEANNVRAWRTVPSQCLRYVEAYMRGGQYDRDLDLIVDQVLSYINEIDPSNDGMDAWILDVDDTCISNLLYYREKRYGCDPFDPAGFKAWALKGGCQAIPAVLGLFNNLVQNGFKVFLITGRDQETLGQVTSDNLHDQGFIGYERLILNGVFRELKKHQNDFSSWCGDCRREKKERQHLSVAATKLELLKRDGISAS
ncbi:hypothetical protein POPTR_006G110900v4 [Populus trichocarpa]|uniref:Uncharacterized protein n=1 Tax=Populus trichocarpa TaxID=3694 RepID=A0ACC0STM9_POPTR|nr:hypothetical protein POPTR_006G110900v4 [Populus trichocarpa]|eukprot:XP_024459070.1 acid phosphatase 1 isoform X2 [Populus trichocarpa]